MNNSTAVEPADDGYVLARNPAEYQRLRVQAGHWAEATEQTFGKVGVGPGWRCLDAGCGPGEVMRMLGQIVGPTGQVTGLDSDAHLGAEALAALRSAGPDIFHFVAADLTKAATVAGAPFDLVFARLVLFHMPDPAAVLKRLWRWVKPGGTLCIMDYDMRTLMSVPADLATGRAFAIIWEAFRQAGKHTIIGAEMPWLFQKEGIGAPDGIIYSGLILPTDEFAKRDPRVMIAAMRDVILANGISTQAELAELETRLDAEAASNVGYIVAASMVSTWKRKPA